MVGTFQVCARCKSACPARTVSTQKWKVHTLEQRLPRVLHKHMPPCSIEKRVFATLASGWRGQLERGIPSLAIDDPYILRDAALANAGDPLEYSLARLFHTTCAPSSPGAPHFAVVGTFQVCSPHF